MLLIQPSERQRGGTHEKIDSSWKKACRLDDHLRFFLAMGFYEIRILVFEELWIGLHIVVHDLGMLSLV